MADEITAETVRLLRYHAGLVEDYGKEPVSKSYAERDYLDKLRWLGEDAPKLVDVLDDYAKLRGFTE